MMTDKELAARLREERQIITDAWMLIKEYTARGLVDRAPDNPEDWDKLGQRMAELMRAREQDPALWALVDGITTGITKYFLALYEKKNL